MEKTVKPDNNLEKENKTKQFLIKRVIDVKRVLSSSKCFFDEVLKKELKFCFITIIYFAIKTYFFMLFSDSLINEIGLFELMDVLIMFYFMGTACSIIIFIMLKIKELVLKK